MRQLRPDLRVLLTTGYAGEENAHMSDNSEFDVLRQPYNLDELARKGRSVLDAKASSEAD